MKEMGEHILFLFSLPLRLYLIFSGQLSHKSWETPLNPKSPPQHTSAQKHVPEFGVQLLPYHKNIVTILTITFRLSC